MRSARIMLAQVLFLAMLIMLSQRPVHAGVVAGSISLDTSALSGTFEIAFVFTDGSGTGDANNSVTLGNFGFGGGSAGSVDPLLTTGGASGDLSSSMVLIDSAFLSIAAAFFDPGAVFSFDFALTTNVDAGGTPDAFSMVLLRGDGSVVATADPSGADALLTLNVDSAQPGFNAFASELSPAPVVTPSVVPEPSTMLLFALAFCGMVVSVATRWSDVPAA
ncbi:MAG TPA: PEP-CTERM sorting domain-containing protein [Casimicrobiaceae bacterium]|nr:PEP-CTERM sorting domain-containing protein [Casimicrobiaceae bacterium]